MYPYMDMDIQIYIYKFSYYFRNENMFEVLISFERIIYKIEGRFIVD